MRIIRRPQQMQEIVRKLQKKGLRVGFVPTMGALHRGHLSLIEAARRGNDKVVVSIFVNPIQFGYNEDFQRYPRDIKKDSSLCRKAGVNYIFYPRPKDMYPDGFKTSVAVEGLSDTLCGFYRLGHFKGVTTVVAKLFNIIPADSAYFGQKDAQQAIIIRRMVRDLYMPVKIEVMPTVREKDGLAMSSRNVYLNTKERKDATVLFKSLKKAQKLLKRGVRDSSKIAEAVKDCLVQIDPPSIDYIAIVDTETLQPLEKIKKRALLALAVRIGSTRLIDNIILKAR